MRVVNPPSALGLISWQVHGTPPSLPKISFKICYDQKVLNASETLKTWFSESQKLQISKILLEKMTIRLEKLEAKCFWSLMVIYGPAKILTFASSRILNFRYRMWYRLICHVTFVYFMYMVLKGFLRRNCQF